eukprot:s120_g8.t1
MDPLHISVKPTLLQNFLQLSCRRWQGGEVVIDKSSLVDLLQKVDGQNRDRNAIGKKLRRVLQTSFFEGNSLDSGSRVLTNTRYKVDILPEVLKHFGLRVAQVSWARIKNTLQDLANTGSLALDDSLNPLEPLQGADIDVHAVDVHVVANPENQIVAVGTEAESPAPIFGTESETAKSKAAPSKRTKRRRTMPSLTHDVGQEAAEQLMPEPELPEPVVPLPSFSSSSSRPAGDSPIEAVLQEYRQQYQGSTTDDLLREIALREEKLQKQIRENNAQRQTIQDLKQKLRGEKQRTRRLTQYNQTLHAKVKSLGGKRGKKQDAPSATDSVEKKMAIERHGKKGRYLTIPSRASLAIRRNMSNAACADVSLILLDDASRFTIARSEVHAGSALVAAVRSFHTNMEEQMMQGPILSLHMITQDATNSSIIQKKKLTALILNSAFASLQDLSQAEHGKKQYSWNFGELFQSTKCVADVQPVEDGTAVGTVALTAKMLQSVGCPSIHSLVECHRSSGKTAAKQADGGRTPFHFSELPVVVCLGKENLSCSFHFFSCAYEAIIDQWQEYFCVWSRPSNDSSLHFFMLTSDRGSNELLARKMWLAVAKDSPEVLVFLGDCLEHAGHLVSLQALKTADALLKNHGVQWKYFSSLATSCNTFRDLAKGIFQSWCEIHGDVSGLKCAKNLWPKLVAGRWNSCNDVEARMEHIGGQRMMQPVLDRVLASRAKGAPGESSGTAAAADRGASQVDDISYEETRRYQEQMGRWRKATVECVNDAMWWVVAAAMRQARLLGEDVQF